MGLEGSARLEELPWGAAEFAVGHRQVLGLKSMGMIPNISNPSCSVPCAALGVLVQLWDPWDRRDLELLGRLWRWGRAWSSSWKG